MCSFCNITYEQLSVYLHIIYKHALIDSFTKSSSQETHGQFQSNVADVSLGVIILGPWPQTKQMF